MLIHGKNHVTGLDPKCIQQNAVDIRVKELLRIHTGDITIGESTKEFFSRTPTIKDKQNLWVLEPGCCYEVITDHTVKIPEGMVGWFVIRSTFARNGLITENGIWDSGYDGSIGTVIHNMSKGVVRIEPNCRIGQFIMAEAETDHLYDGYYNHNKR